MAAEYVSLHSHYHHSLLDGFSNVDEYLDRAVELGMKGLGSADHGNMHNAFEFVNSARARGITPVPGIEAYMAPINPEGARVKKPVYYGPVSYGKSGQQVPLSKHDVSSNGAYLHLTLWAVNNTGLKNLFRLSTQSYHEDNTYFKNRIDFDMLAENSEGIVCATGCPSSEVSTRLRLGQDKEAYEYAGRLLELFGKERLFVEVMNHEMSNDLERLLLPKQVKLAKDLGLGLLATNDTHYVNAEDRIQHERMLCMQSGSVMSQKTYDEGGTRFAFDGGEFYLKSGEQMARLFSDEDFPGALSNSLLITEMAQDVSLDFDSHLRAVVPTPADFPDELSYFKHLINEGYKEKYGSASPEVREEAKRRIRDEFPVIHSSDFLGYFLTVREYLAWTRENFSTRDKDGNILALPIGPNRGSAGGCIISYLLGITDVDPIRFGLIFERFLSAGRGATYQITYDDGTTEELVVSEEKKVVTESGSEGRYIYQLNVGDEVEL